MKYLATFSRVLVGVEFIFSGFVKVVDPYGFSIKLQEYFEVFSKDLPVFASFFHFFAENSLTLSLLICCFEFVLGFALLFSFRMKFTAWVVLLFMTFFTFLTFYSAYFNKVTDCGCFGDFLKLKPWHSFIKDIISMFFIAIIFSYRNRFNKSELGTPLVMIATLISLGIGIYAIRYSPLLEFVAYSVGKNIPEQMKPTGVKPVIEYQFLDKTTNKEIESAEYLEDTIRYKYISSETLNQSELTPKITDYSLSDTSGADKTQESLTGNKLLLVIKYSDGLEAVSFKRLFSLASKAVRKKVKTVILTSMSQADFNLLNDKEEFPFEVYFGDEKVLKTMARTNPGLILLKDGKVLGKWSLNNLPDLEQISNLLNKE